MEPADAKRAGMAAVRDLNRVLAALMIEAVDQVQDPSNTFRHDESTTYLHDLVLQAVSVDYITPEAAVFGLARANAAMLVELCKRVGIDPRSFVKRYEEVLFRLEIDAEARDLSSDE